MFRKILAATAALTLGLGGVLALAGPASATPPTGHKVLVCHATSGLGELKNGYNSITVDIASAGYPDSEGNNNHASHDGTQGNKVGPDIIGAYTYQPPTPTHGPNEGVKPPLFTFPGYNLGHVFSDGTTGAEFLVNGCQLNTPVQPADEVTTSTDTRKSCANGVEEQVTKTTTSYAWVDGQWVLDPDTAVVVVGDWTFVRNLTEEEQVELDCVNQPPPLVTTSDWVDGDYQCDDTTVEQTRTVTTTPYVLDGENGYVLDEANATTVTETQTRDLTADEQTACPTDNPNPPKDNPPKDNPPAELPGTGAGDILPFAGLGIVILLSGLLAYMVTNRRRSSI
jgi:hypothetical protein